MGQGGRIRALGGGEASVAMAGPCSRERNERCEGREEKRKERECRGRRRHGLVVEVAGGGVLRQGRAVRRGSRRRRWSSRGAVGLGRCAAPTGARGGGSSCAHARARGRRRRLRFLARAGGQIEEERSGGCGRSRSRWRLAAVIRGRRLVGGLDREAIPRWRRQWVAADGMDGWDNVPRF